jgi:hypothetical protein
VNGYREYHYVGDQTIKERQPVSPERVCVRTSDDVLRWINDTKQRIDRDRRVSATFIVDMNKLLWISDQRSEHVHCAAGKNVLSAGEMTFHLEKRHIEVIEVTNQSTGYCPEPESWWAVNAALAPTGLTYPEDFTTAYLFRRCDMCGTTNLIKEMWFECGMCQAPLSKKWNYG